MKIFAILTSIVRTALIGFAMCGFAHAADQGTAPEAEALVKRAVALIKSAGPEKAYEEFNNGKSFKDRDLYIVVYDMTGKNLAHGGNTKLVGKDLSGAKDPDGKLVVKMFLDLAKEKGKGWSDGYKFMNPVTQKIGGKVFYLERLGDTLVGCGIYKD